MIGRKTNSVPNCIQEILQCALSCMQIVTKCLQSPLHTKRFFLAIRFDAQLGPIPAECGRIFVATPATSAFKAPINHQIVGCFWPTRCWKWLLQPSGRLLVLENPSPVLECVCINSAIRLPQLGSISYVFSTVDVITHDLRLTKPAAIATVRESLWLYVRHVLK